jgi:hypothetical protein
VQQPLRGIATLRCIELAGCDSRARGNGEHLGQRQHGRVLRIVQPPAPTSRSIRPLICRGNATAAVLAEGEWDVDRRGRQRSGGGTHSPSGVDPRCAPRRMTRFLGQDLG